MEMGSSYRQFFIIAIVLHILIFILFAMGFQITGKNYVVENTANAPIINAMVMATPPPVKPQIKPVPPVQAAPTPPPPPAPPRPVKKPPQATAPTKPVVVPPKADEIALEKKKQKKLKQEQIEKQLLVDLKKIKVKQKIVKQKSLEEAFEKEIKNLSLKKQQSQRDQQRVEGDHEQLSQGDIDKYKALVLQAIGHRWLIPGNVDKNLATKLVIYLAPGGGVLDVDIYESSGNPALDSSARAAVFKASPLPVPTDAERFKFFKRFVLVFRPINFQNGQLES